MAIEVNVDMVKSLLGPLGEWWTSDQITSPVVTVPARQEMERICPTVDVLIGTQEEQIAMVALANLIAAELLTTTPEVSSSDMGDTSVTYATGALARRAAGMVQRAHALMGDVCPVSLPNVAVFRTAPGGRGL